jgi:hypothetical protein
LDEPYWGNDSYINWRMLCQVTLTHANKFTMHTFVLLWNMVYFFEVILPTVGRFSNYRKKIVWTTAYAQNRISCRNLFKKLEILSIPCQYILSLMSFIINNQEFFKTNSSIANMNTKNKYHLQRPNANLSFFCF